VKKSLLEYLGLERLDGNTWMVTPKPAKGYADYAGIDVGKPVFKRGEAMALARVKPNFEPDTVASGRAPVGDVDPMDLVKMLKTGEEIKVADTGEVLLPEPGLREHVIEILARHAQRVLAGVGKVDIVTNISSSKPFAVELARSIAAKIGAEFVPSGVMKTKDPSRVKLDPGKETSKSKSAQGNLARFQRGIAAGEEPSIKKTFGTHQRNLVRGFLEPSPDARKRVEDVVGLRTVVIDDVLTTGQSGHEAQLELEAIGYDVVAFLAAFRAG
jgi:hypothetical protein